VLRDSPLTADVSYIDWVNSAQVRKLLNIPDKVQAWTQCDDNITYTMDEKASQWIYEELKGKYRILFYSGNTDGAVPTHGSQKWM